MPIDALKPAESVLRDVVSDQRRVAAVSALVGLVSAYGLELMAAGVDDAALVPVLVREGITLGQGRAVSAAAPPGPAGSTAR